MRSVIEAPPRGGGGAPILTYTGTCRWVVYGFWPLFPEQCVKFDAS